MKQPRLMPRLQKIYDIAIPCETVADIGTDHAYIPLCLYLNGKCKRAIASDVGKGPLERAKSTLNEYGADNIFLRLGSGLSTLSPKEAEVIIIAGMGGILIGEILNASENIAKTAKQLVLQPMTAVPELREYLINHGYKIEKEYLVREDEKIYTIISVSVGDDKPYTKAELYMGKQLDRNNLYLVYRAERLKKLDRRINGLAQSRKEENQALLKELINLKEMIENENL